MHANSTQYSTHSSEQDPIVTMYAALDLIYVSSGHFELEQSMYVHTCTSLTRTLTTYDAH